MTRKFEDYEAATATKAMPLIVGVTGPQFSGKTFSAHRLAAGIVRVTGGEVFGVDTEADRMLHYKGLFNFRHVPFPPPHNPASYEAAIAHCIARGAGCIVVDSMSHEHTGEGGLLDMVEDFLQRKAGDDYEKRDKLKWAAQIAPKAERKRLNRMIAHTKIPLVLCYRAEDKTKPVAGGKPQHLGWQADTTSKLPYDMTVRFLLPPASEGHPNLKPDTEWEKLSIKNPGIFADWFKPGFQLTEEIGERLARWAQGGEAGGERLMLLAQIRSALTERHPGRTKEEQDAKAALLGIAFAAKRWADVEDPRVPLDRLREGLATLRGEDREREPGSDEAEDTADLFAGAAV